jgi:hypothetical protein
MEEDSDSSDENPNNEDDDESSVENDRYGWGDHVSHRDALTFNVQESDSEDDEPDEEEELRHRHRFYHRGSRVGRNFFSTRVHLFNVLNGLAGNGNNEG